MRDLSCGDTRISKRFAYFVGRRCREATIKDAKEPNLHWHTVKKLEKQYMTTQLARAGTAGPKVIGIDEIAIRKGRTYPIVVSDLLRHRPIWLKIRSCGSKSSRLVQLADMCAGAIARSFKTDKEDPFRCRRKLGGKIEKRSSFR